MSIAKETKNQLTKQFATTPNDTGSIEVQVAILTERIKNLTEHLKTHAKDFSSRNGLLVLVARRKRLLHYLESTNIERYSKLINTLNLKK